MNPPPDVWCAIPVYNNVATIKDIATRARAQLPYVLVIDDGSTDANLAERLNPSEFTLLRHPTNQGKGAALRTAMQYAHDHGARYLITLDADGQHFPEDIPRFLPHLTPDAILLGHRAEISGDMPNSSRFGREFSDFWIHLESGKTVLDSQSGFRAYPLPASLNLNVHSLRYGFEVEILTRALWSNLAVASIPIRVHYPPRAQRISSFHPLRDNTRLTLLHAKLIARQLLPLPHKKTQGEQPCGTAAPGCVRPKVENHFNPFNSALTAALTTFFTIVLYPWGFLAIAYLLIRLHLNKLVALVFLFLFIPPAIPPLSTRIGHTLLHLDSHPHFERFLGAHIIAFPAALAAGALAYTVARSLTRERGAP